MQTSAEEFRKKKIHLGGKKQTPKHRRTNYTLIYEYDLRDNY